MNEHHYVFDNSWQRGRERLDAVEALLDPGTVQLLSRLEVGAGWRCLEIGAGGGSIAQWLHNQVSPTGHVVATDLDIRYLEPLARANLEVRQHDVAQDDL